MSNGLGHDGCKDVGLIQLAHKHLLATTSHFANNAYALSLACGGNRISPTREPKAHHYHHNGAAKLDDVLDPNTCGPQSVLNPTSCMIAGTKPPASRSCWMRPRRRPCTVYT